MNCRSTCFEDIGLNIGFKKLTSWVMTLLNSHSFRVMKMKVYVLLTDILQSRMLKYLCKEITRLSVSYAELMVLVYLCGYQAQWRMDLNVIFCTM